jgi:diguanylate cyclase (GGDEF)-like protein
VARLGGDEFAIVLTGLEEPGQCSALRQKIEAAISQPTVLDGVSLTPVCSVGCVLYPRDGQTLNQLLKAADDHMYEIKRTHKEDQASAAA